MPSPLPSNPGVECSDYKSKIPHVCQNNISQQRSFLWPGDPYPRKASSHPSDLIHYLFCLRVSFKDRPLPPGARRVHFWPVTHRYTPCSVYPERCFPNLCLIPVQRKRQTPFYEVTTKVSSSKKCFRIVLPCWLWGKLLKFPFSIPISLANLPSFVTSRPPSSPQCSYPPNG